VVDLGSAAALLRGLQFVSPRGRFDLAFFADRLALLAPAKAAAAASADAQQQPAALVLPYADVEALLVLEKPAEGGVKAGAAWSVLLALSPDAPAAFGKQRLACLLLSCSASEQLACASPAPGGAPLAGPAPQVLGEALARATGRAAETSSFRSSRAAPCLPAHVKVTPGLLYPLRCGLAFVSTSKPLFLPCARWDGVAVGRAGGGTNATFDLKVGDVEFAMISRDELPAVQEYVAGRTRALERQAARAAGEAAAAAPSPAAEAESDDDSDEDEDFQASEGERASGGSGGGEESESGEDGGGWGMVAADSEGAGGEREGDAKKARHV